MQARPWLSWFVLGTSVAVLLLSCGCASTAVPTTVQVPIPIICRPDLPKRPDLPTASLPTKSDPYTRAKAVLADRMLLLQHVETLERTLQSCN